MNMKAMSLLLFLLLPLFLLLATTVISFTLLCTLDKAILFSQGYLALNAHKANTNINTHTFTFSITVVVVRTQTQLQIHILWTWLSGRQLGWLSKGLLTRNSKKKRQKKKTLPVEENEYKKNTSETKSLSGRT